jgi:hypothetical protein
VNLNLRSHKIIIEDGTFEGLVNLRSLDLAFNREILNLNYVFNRDTINLITLNLRGGERTPIRLQESGKSEKEEEEKYNELALALKLCRNKVVVFAQSSQLGGPHLLNTLNDDGLIDLVAIDYGQNTRQVI